MEVDTALQLRRLIALRHLDRYEEGVAQARYLNWEFRQALRAGDFTHGREMARFYLDVELKPALALLAASHNLELQREAEDHVLYRRALALVQH